MLGIDDVSSKTSFTDSLTNHEELNSLTKSKVATLKGRYQGRLGTKQRAIYVKFSKTEDFDVIALTASSPNFC